MISTRSINNVFSTQCYIKQFKESCENTDYRQHVHSVNSWIKVAKQIILIWWQLQATKLGSLGIFMVPVDKKKPWFQHGCKDNNNLRWKGSYNVQKKLCVSDGLKTSALSCNTGAKL